MCYFSSSNDTKRDDINMFAITLAKKGKTTTSTYDSVSLATDDVKVVDVKLGVAVNGVDLLEHLHGDIDVTSMGLEHVTMQILVVYIPVLAPRSFDLYFYTYTCLYLERNIWKKLSAANNNTM